MILDFLVIAKVPHDAPSRWVKINVVWWVL